MTSWSTPPDKAAKDDVQGAFVEALWAGDLVAMKEAVAQGADIDLAFEGSSPLVHAIRGGEDDIAVYLIETGADLDLGELDAESLHGGDVPMVSRWRTPIAALFALQNVAISCAVDNAMMDVVGNLAIPINTGIAEESLRGFCLRVLLRVLGVATVTKHYSDFKFAWPRIVTVAASATLMRNLLPTFGALSFVGLLWSGQSKLWHQMVRYCLRRGEFFCCVLLAERPTTYLVHLLFHSAKDVLTMEPDNRHTIDEPAGVAVLRAVFSMGSVSAAVIDALLAAHIFTAEFVTLDQRRYDGYTSEIWRWAVSNGETRVVRRLLGLGFSADPTDLETVAKLGHRESFDLLLERLHQHPYPQQYMDNALLANVLGLYRQRHDLASLQSMGSIADTLLDEGASSNTADWRGCVLLSHAVKSGDVSTARHLLDWNADATIPDKEGRSPIFYISEDHNAALLIDLLVEAGADVNATAKGGLTPLMMCARRSLQDAVRALLLQGASVNVVDDDRRDAFDHACCGEGEVAVLQRLLIAQGTRDAATITPSMAIEYAFYRDNKMRANLTSREIGQSQWSSE